MCLNLTANFISLNINELDLAVRASDSDCFTSLIEFDDVSNCISRVQIGDLLDLPDVPDLDDTVGVTGGDVLAADGEGAIIDSVEMSVESLYSEAGAHIPNRHGSIGGAADEEVGEGLEIQAIHRVCVLSVLLAHLQRV